MESGTESDVEDLQLFPAASIHQTTANEKEAKKEESAVWLYFEKIKNSGQSGTGYRVECTEYGKNEQHLLYAPATFGTKTSH